jgi:type II secretory pathway pseudopilin PulG
MKKTLSAMMCLVLLAASAMPAWAQTSRRYTGRTTAQQYRRYENSRRANYDRRYYENGRYNDRSVWERSRDKITVAGGAGAGAVIGGLAGGKKGAIIGAIIGGGGSALYTYKVRDRDERRRRYRR